ncbi:hypothetical protein H696_04423 [Fonticula alba]|uniref:Uncharacterized protein n=1 Tax=Fonticula alba TaxID=691883 RepID=A0A058Z524_FONAL|nr:hypothetical protein H696_04423 [Fonticula alba]KCV69003.1 hypothetical protein H696_04423 [Fonticula alba]|eukprot:XP_009496574.1 hypothetical protein H696_04423 [Fonticula alba]
MPPKPGRVLPVMRQSPDQLLEKVLADDNTRQQYQSLVAEAGATAALQLWDSHKAATGHFPTGGSAAPLSADQVSHLVQTFSPAFGLPADLPEAEKLSSMVSTAAGMLGVASTEPTGPLDQWMKLPAYNE